MKIAISVSEKEKAKGNESLYFRALVAAGARPDELELVTTADARRLRAEDFDGAVFAGGEDVDPSFYEEATKYPNVKVDHARDKFELTLLDRSLNLRLPILGICRGTQMINVKFGGALYQDLKSDLRGDIEHKQAAPRNETTHSVALTDPGSMLATAFRGSCRVNSLHHQAIKRVGRGLRITAYSEDGLVEAVEAADDYPFLVAVQWHPEEMANQAEQRKIFELFLSACREAAARRRARVSS